MNIYIYQENYIISIICIIHDLNNKFKQNRPFSYSKLTTSRLQVNESVCTKDKSCIYVYIICVSCTSKSYTYA